MRVANPAQLVWYVTGRFYTNEAGDLLDAGYFLHLQGIEGELFDGERSEATARFTFLSKPFASHTLANGALNIGIDARGTFSVYLRETGGASFDDPNSFAEGHCIATFARVSLVATTETTALFSNVFSATLIESEAFEFRGRRYDFRQLVGHGITQWGVAVPGSDPAVPFVGSAIHVG